MENFANIIGNNGKSNVEADNKTVISYARAQSQH